MNVRESLKQLGRTLLLRRTLSLLIVILLLGAVLTVFFPDTFMTEYNFGSVLLNMSFDVIIVVGMALLLIGGEVDLSMGWNLSLSGIIYAMLMTQVGWPAEWAIPATLGVAVVLGLIVGYLVAYVKVNSFIATLAAGLIYYGLEFWLAGGISISHLDHDLTWIGQDSFLGLQLPTWYALVIVGLFLYLMGRTRLFKQYYYIGLNKEVALHSGIRVQRLKMYGFVISSVLASFAGIISAARFGSAMLLVGQGMELKAITAAMVGGVSFFGGIGTMLGAVLGESFIALINNGMIIANINAFWQPILIGVILLLAVILDVVLVRTSTGMGRVSENGKEKKASADK